MHALSSASSWASSKAAAPQPPAPTATAAPRRASHGFDSWLVTASRRPSRRKSEREERFRAGQTTGDGPLTRPPNLAITRGANERCVPPSNAHNALSCSPGADGPVCPNNARKNQHSPPLLRPTRAAVADRAGGKICAATALAAVGSSTGGEARAVNADEEHLPFRPRDGRKLYSSSLDLSSSGRFVRASAVTVFRPSSASALATVGGSAAEGGGSGEVRAVNADRKCLLFGARASSELCRFGRASAVTAFVPSSVSALAAVGGSAGEVRAVNADGEELPFRIVDGRKFYLDELDVAGLLDGQSYLRPFDPSTYDAAAFLWKKIGDIPEERRHRLLDLLLPRHIQAMWEVAGTRYEDEDEVEDGEEAAPAAAAVIDTGPATTAAATAAATTAASMLPCAGRSVTLKAEVWDGLVTGLPRGLGWLARFQKAFFLGADGLRYGRVISGGPLFTGLSNIITPLYFRVLDASSTPVVATGDAAEVCFDYGDGQLHMAEPGCLPPGFPSPRPHLPLFDDDMRDYVRAVGPGVVVGQTWQEGRRLDSVPKRFLGEFILVRSSA